MAMVSATAFGEKSGSSSSMPLSVPFLFKAAEMSTSPSASVVEELCLGSFCGVVVLLALMLLRV